VKFLNDSMPWATIMLAILVGVAAIAGAVVVIVHGEALSFQQYLDILKNFAVAVGIVGVGRGISSYGKQVKSAALLNDTSLAPPPVSPVAPVIGATDGMQPTSLYPAPGYDAGMDPYADVAWVEAAPPPPAPVEDRQPLEV
jgi:hypothetical protein